jgi:hypothetical protein
VMIAGLTGIAQARPMTETPGAAAFFEDFEAVTMPALPDGWTDNINSTNINAAIITSSLASPHSGTQAVRFGNSTDANAVLILSTLPAKNFESNWLTFWAKMGSNLHSTDLIVGTMTDPNDAQTFTPADTVLVEGNVYQQYRVQFQGIQDQETFHIAFRYAPGFSSRFLYMDDVAWEQAPAHPLPVILPGQGDFGVVDLHSEAVMEFSLANHGVNTLVIQESDFSFSGEDAAMFSVQAAFDYPLEVGFNESIPLLLSFVPESGGVKTAQLQMSYNAPEPALTLDLTGTGLPVQDTFTEDFSGCVPPELAGGWSGIVTATAAILPVSNNAPLTPPYHVRVTTGADYDAVAYLVGPRVRNFETNWLRFYARMSASAHTENIVVGVMSQRDDMSTFTPVSTVAVQGMEYQQHTVYMTPMEDTDTFHIAFKFSGSDNHRTFFFDEVLWDAIPTEPVFLLHPETFDYPVRQIHTESPAQWFTITNDGPVPFSFGPNDIQLTGDHAAEFKLVDAPQQTVELAFGDTAGFSVAFAPQTPGDKQLTLQVRDQSFTLSGTAIDATITQVPHFEDFDGVSIPNLPLGWGRIVYNPGLTSAHVNTVTIGSPRSAPNHVSLNSNQHEPQDVILVSPPVTNLPQKRIRFWARAAMSSNMPDLVVGTMTDAEDAATFTPFHTLEALEEFSDTYQQFVITFDETIGENTYVAFRHGGTPNFNRAIYIDDFLIENTPDSPVLVTDTDSIPFGSSQKGYASFPVSITLGNEGIGTLVLNAADLSITGPDADHFAVVPFTEPLEIEPFETATIALKFHPLSTGERSAVLHLMGHTVALTGEGIDATITALPHLEDFDAVTAPELPSGWLGHVDNPTLASATVEVLTTSTPHSAPNHARLFSNQNKSATVVLISPPVTNLNEVRLRFYAKTNLASNAPDLIIATTSTPADTASYNVIAVIEGATSLTTTYQEFTVPLAMAGDDTRIVFRHGGTPNLTRSIFLDDIVLEMMPEDPRMVVTPLEHAFGIQQTGTMSDAAEFTILNNGGGQLSLEPSAITLTGEDAADFALVNLPEAVHLAGGQTATLSVRFAPLTTGDKQATLMIDTLAIPLTGEGFDATIAQFPYLETFSDTPVGSLPLGWTTDRTNWSVVNTNFTGGGAPEVRFNYTPVFNGVSYLKTPAINTSEFDKMLFAFRHHLNNFSTPGIYTVRVVTIVGDQEYLVQEWVDPSNIPAEDLQFVLTEDHGIGAELLQIAWIFDGNSNDINQYYINNVFLDAVPDTHTITFQVNSTAGQPVEDAVITFGETTNAPGDYVFENVSPGPYDWSITADHFEPLSQTGYLVEWDATINAVLTPLTYTVTFNVEDQDGAPIADAVITLGGVTNPAGDYVFDNVTHGTYSYTIQASHYETVQADDLLVAADTTTDITMNAILYDVTFVVQDAAGDPIPDAVVSFGDQTNPAGDYAFTGLTHGLYNYSVTAPHFDTQAQDDFLLEENTTINVTLQASSYQVTFLVVNSQGAAIADAVVTFDGVANPQGQYTFENVLPGEYAFDVTADHYNAHTGNLLVEADVQVEVTLTDIAFVVSFSVSGEQGQAIADAVITLGDVTNPAGDYVFEQVLPGLYAYSVQAGGYHPFFSDDFMVSEDLSIDVTLTLITHTVTFVVEDEAGDAVADAVITFDGIPAAPGEYVFAGVLPGTYDYSVAADGFHEVPTTSLTVAGDITVPVVMTRLPETFALTLNVDMSGAEGFDPATHQVYVAGNFGGDMQWNAPGSNPDLLLARQGESMTFSITLELPAGDYAYKYASNAFGEGWEGAEWVGDPNREITMDGAMSVDDLWGVHPGNVSVPVAQGPEVRVYPNPATSHVNIVSGATILEVLVIDFRGQVIAAVTGSGHSHRLDTGQLSPGVYFIQVHTAEGLRTERIQVVR